MELLSNYCLQLSIIIKLFSIYCQLTVELLPNYSFITVKLMSDYCEVTVELLPNYCWLLFDYCQITVGARARVGNTENSNP